MFSRILIANRGEIALRIIRACRELDIETVAVFSEADRDALYLRYADISICIGPPEAMRSYLNISQIISAAEIGYVDAIHPGYGFLAESSHFAEICESSAIKFIGPAPEVMNRMGDKATAREIARKAGVPVVPGSEGAIEDEKQALELAHKIGFPVMIKAAMGGGGRGMRIARNDLSLVHGIIAARNEAESAFKSGAIYLEKYVERPRHVEVQILCDHHGNMIHVGERDCSLQRRHQKLVEESPSPAVDAALRKKLGEDALKVASTVGYTNAGTVEFIVDQTGRHYFIEMNKRIQVEHPVTEMVSGLDLVKEQIRIAAGEKLSLKQSEVKLKGVAIECRINAEDPREGFKPCPGRISRYFAPGGMGVRVDSHVYAGYEISPYYDSLISKLIVHQPDRQGAIEVMKRALREYVVEGVQTTIPLYLDLFEHQHFVEGRVDTGFIEEHYT